LEIRREFEMSNNISDLASYFAYISSNSDVNQYVSGSAGGALVDALSSSDLSSLTATLGAWNINLSDLLVNSPLTLTYDITNYLTDPSYLVVGQSSFSGSGRLTSYNFASDPNTVSVSDIYAFYQEYASQIGSLAWNNTGTTNRDFPTSSNSDSSIWSDPANQQILNYWHDIQVALGQLPGKMPSSFQEFLQGMQSLQVAPAASVPPGNFDPSQAPSGMISAVSLTPEAAPVSSGDTSSVLSDLLNGFIANYQSLYPQASSSTITPETFATQFEDYIQNNLAQDVQSASIQIVINDPGSATPIPLQQTTGASLFPNSSAITNSLNFPSDFVTQFVAGLQNEYVSALNAATAGLGITLPDAATLTTDFNNAFNYFIQQVTSSNSNLSTKGADFFSMWSDYVGPSTLLGTASGSGASILNTYERMYNAFYPNQQPSNFSAQLNNFIQNALSSNSGVFNPNLLLDQWFQALKTGFAPTTDQTSLAAGNFSNTRIINQVYQNLIDVINELQNLTLAQANRLNFYSDYAQAYTDAINAIPFLVPGDGTPIDLAADDPNTLATGTGSQDIQTTTTAAEQAAALRQQANAAANQWVQNLQNYRSQVTANAQAQQTTVQQTNSAVNQQTNFATNILQMLNQLTQMIFSNIQSNIHSSGPS